GTTPPPAHAETGPLAYAWVAVPGFDLAGAIAGGGLRIDRLEAHSKSAHIRGHGRIATSGALALDLRASFPEIGDDPNLRRLVPNASGRLDAELRIGSEQIAKSKLRFEGRVVLRNLRYRVLRADSLTLIG